MVMHRKDSDAMIKHDWHAKGRINAIPAICGFEFVTLVLFETTINF